MGLREDDDSTLTCPASEVNSKSLDLFENAFSFGKRMTNATCCASDNKRKQVLCGRGTSCAGECSAQGATLCPSGNCTDNPEDCKINMTLEGLATSFCSSKEAKLCPSGQCVDILEDCESRSNRRGFTPSLLPSWVFSWCTNKCQHVRRYPACCFHPKCLRKRRLQCKWLENYLGSSCPRPASIQRGTWTCLTQEIPIEGSNILLDEVTTYPGSLWPTVLGIESAALVSALQCRLYCQPGYVSQQTPIITCVNGR